jgi:hypothetical protein
MPPECYQRLQAQKYPAITLTAGISSHYRFFAANKHDAFIDERILYPVDKMGTVILLEFTERFMTFRKNNSGIPMVGKEEFLAFVYNGILEL